MRRPSASDGIEIPQAVWRHDPRKVSSLQKHQLRLSVAGPLRVFLLLICRYSRFSIVNIQYTSTVLEIARETLRTEQFSLLQN